MNKVKRIGVLTSGGDAPGMNAAVRAVARTALANGIECIGIRRGWQGLINSDFINLSKESVGHILARGGTILYTARSEDFLSERGRMRAVGTCTMLGLDGIVAIGGDGTFRGALELSRLGIPVVGVPATIDNDVGCTNYTIGFDTACNTAIECIDKLRDTMQSHERCSVVEVMGRNAGFLALYVGIAVGATAVLVPEKPYDFEKDVVERIQESRLAGNTHFMIVVAEGAGNAMEIGEKIDIRDKNVRSARHLAAPMTETLAQVKYSYFTCDATKPAEGYDEVSVAVSTNKTVLCIYSTVKCKDADDAKLVGHVFLHTKSLLSISETGSCDSQRLLL